VRGTLRLGSFRVPREGALDLNHADSSMIRGARNRRATCLVSSHQNCAVEDLCRTCGQPLQSSLRGCQVCWNSVSAEAWNEIVRLRVIQQDSLGLNASLPQKEIPNAVLAVCQMQQEGEALRTSLCPSSSSAYLWVIDG
jgi:hypothetical protein